jgi:hypothetical protein
MTPSTSILDEFETLFSKNFGAAKCWRCDDGGALQSASIVPRHPACECETAGREIEGYGYHKRIQQGRAS